MYQEETEIITDDAGHVGVRNTIVTDTISVQQLAAMIRNMPKEQRESFGKQCRVVGVVPMYSPTGAFDTNFTVLKADRDQLDWLLKRFPEYRTG